MSKEFERRAQCVVDQYGGYTAIDDLHLNGKLTLGENIADLGGIKQAYEAWKQYEKEHPQTKPYVAGLTNDQLLFVAYAQGWCAVASEEYKRMMLNLNSHSDAKYRVIGPLASLPAFAEAFQCAPGTPMAPTDRCEVW